MEQWLSPSCYRKQPTEVSTKFSCSRSGALSWLLSALGLLGIGNGHSFTVFALFTEYQRSSLLVLRPSVGQEGNLCLPSNRCDPPLLICCCLQLVQLLILHLPGADRMQQAGNQRCHHIGGMGFSLAVSYHTAEERESHTWKK